MECIANSMAELESLRKVDWEEEYCIRCAILCEKNGWTLDHIRDNVSLPQFNSLFEIYSLINEKNK